jgi:F0F1-type ATP synthase delta subunit
MKTCVITAASNMTDATFGVLCEKARAKFGYEIQFQRITDDSVIGGFIMELDGTVYDLSIKTQLDLMKQKMVYDEEGQE